MRLLDTEKTYAEMRDDIFGTVRPSMNISFARTRLDDSGDSNGDSKRAYILGLLLAKDNVESANLSQFLKASEMILTLGKAFV